MTRFDTATEALLLLSDAGLAPRHLNWVADRLRPLQVVDGVLHVNGERVLARGDAASVLRQAYEFPDVPVSASHLYVGNGRRRQAIRNRIKSVIRAIGRRDPGFARELESRWLLDSNLCVVVREVSSNPWRTV